MKPTSLTLLLAVMPREEVVVLDEEAVEGVGEEVEQQIQEITAMTIAMVMLEEEEEVVAGLYGVMGPHEVLLLPLEEGGVEDLPLPLHPHLGLHLRHLIGTWKTMRSKVSLPDNFGCLHSLTVF